MNDNLTVIEAVAPERFVATLDNVGAELARITASLAQALTLPPLDALQQLRQIERRAEWLHHGARSAARSARFYLVWQNRFAGERFRCLRAIGNLLIVLLRHQGGRPSRTLSDAEGFTLEALFGRDAYNFSAECQAIARMPQEVFDAYLLTGESADDLDDRNPQAPELSKAGLLRWGERHFHSPAATANDDTHPHSDVHRLNIDVGRRDIELYEKSQTDRAMARLIVEHFNPKGRILEPCAGNGAFFRAFPESEIRLWCEIRKGRDFLKFNEKVDWIITNIPWNPEDLYNAIIRHCLELADNVVILAHVGSALTVARIRDFLDAGHGLKEIFFVDNKEAGFPGGKALAALHWQRGWTGPVIFTYWQPPPWYVPARWVILVSVRGVFGASAVAHGRVPAGTMRR